MRPVLVIDLTTAARALLAAPSEQRMQLSAKILQDADFGDRYRRRFKQSHARFGNGTLAAAAQKICFGCRAYGRQFGLLRMFRAGFVATDGAAHMTMRIIMRFSIHSIW